MPSTDFQPYREPLRVTLLRNGTIALVVGGVLALSRGRLARWPAATLLVLWPALGGHWVEIGFLNWLRPRIATGRAVQVAARIAVWFVGGAVLWIAMGLTARALSAVGWAPWPASQIVRFAAVGGLTFIGVELVVHLAMNLRGLPSFYDGRG